MRWLRIALLVLLPGCLPTCDLDKCDGHAYSDSALFADCDCPYVFQLPTLQGQSCTGVPTGCYDHDTLFACTCNDHFPRTWECSDGANDFSSAVPDLTPAPESSPDASDVD
jgi:hypothetical protein